jgi:N-acetylglucosaminyldiphosphoundecaprenol N-acetyl-beta-D-mannosaminyltransferase
MREQLSSIVTDPDHSYILGMRVDPTSYAEVCELVNRWSSERIGRYICIANVHMTMEAYDHPEYQQVVNQADLVTPDGMPLVWMLRHSGYPDQERVYGPTLTEKLLGMAAREHIPVGFFGSTEEVVELLVQNVRHSYPETEIVYSYSPPFKEPTSEEDNAIIDQIRSSGTRILFVGLGCPKQEKWMHEHRGKIPAVMLGVGAAFDFIAGIKPQAPMWVQKIGFEWLFRLVSEPKRLWKRYFHHNPRFLYYATRQLIRNKF